MVSWGGDAAGVIIFLGGIASSIAFVHVHRSQPNKNQWVTMSHTKHHLVHKSLLANVNCSKLP